MSLHKLVFDATDADTIAASANVGAYLRSADGTLITHTTVGGKEALDVRVAEGINVEVDLDAADDSVESWTNDGSGNPIGSTGGYLHVLAQQDTSPWVIGDGGASLTVDATQLDIDDLNATDDAVQAWAFDGTGNAITSTTGYLDVNIAAGSVTVSDAALANSAIKTVAETVGTSAALIIDGADELSGRKYVYLYNNDNRYTYLGASGVTTSNGFPLPPGAIIDVRIGDAVDLYMIADAAGQNIRTMQLS